MISVSSRELEIVLDIIKTYAPAYDVLAFGSRFHGKIKKYSDLDLAFVGKDKLSLKTRFLLEDAFSESDLPFRVDVLDYLAVSPEFRAIIDGGSGMIYSANGKCDSCVGGRVEDEAKTC